MPKDDIEINVIEGYRFGGGMILACSLAMIWLITSAPHRPGTTPPSLIAFELGTMPFVIGGLLLCLSVSRIRFSPQNNRTVVERGVWPLVVRRIEDTSGEKRLMIHAFRGGKGGRFVKIDLKLADGRQFPILRDVSSSRFDVLAQAASTIGARLVLVGPMESVPDWLLSRVGRFRIERYP